jgi:hypothetical protein
MPGRFFKQHDGVFYRTKWREASIQAEGIRRDVLVVEDAPGRSTVKHFSKNTDSAFFIQALRLLPCRHNWFITAFITRLSCQRW